jgi:hypothetical protein
MFVIARASVHIPFFMDGRPFASIEGGLPGLGGARDPLLLDGSFLMPAESELRLSPAHPTLILDHGADPVLTAARGGPADFVRLTTPTGIKSMMRLGYDYAAALHHKDGLEVLRPIARRQPSASSHLVVP